MSLTDIRIFDKNDFDWPMTWLHVKYRYTHTWSHWKVSVIWKRDPSGYGLYDLNFRDRLLMQNLWPVGSGPSSKTWPKWASHWSKQEVVITTMKLSETLSTIQWYNLHYKVLCSLASNFHSKSLEQNFTRSKYPDM